MRYKGLIGIILILAIVAVAACSSLTQKSTESSKPEGSYIIVKGKIVQFGGRYYVRGENPPGEFLIMNEEPNLLGKILKSGKTVTIEGRLTMGADLLLIDKIDGQPYFGKQ